MDILRMHVAKGACLAFFGSRHRPYQWSAETASTTSLTSTVISGCSIDSICGFLWMPPKSKAKVNPFQRVLGPIEDRLDFLDEAIRELHPEYSSRMLDRMAYLEDLCRQHVTIAFWK